MYDFTKHKFRCSSLGHLMTDPKTKAEKEAGELSETAKTHLMDIFISQQFGRKTDINNKFLEKGLANEEDSITFLSRVNKIMYRKNDQRLFNDYIQGEPDILPDPSNGNTVFDVKTSWDAFTFFRTYDKKMKDLYLWQLRGYSWLTGAENAKLAYCLTNTPKPLIEAEKRRLWYQLGQPADDNENWQDAQRVIDRAMIFDDIPLNNRVLLYDVDLSGDWKDEIILRVRKARGYLVKLQSELTPKLND